MVERLKLTQLYTAPTALRLLMKSDASWVTRYDRSSLRVLGSVGEPINAEAWKWCAAPSDAALRCSACVVCTMYAACCTARELPGPPALEKVSRGDTAPPGALLRSLAARAATEGRMYDMRCTMCAMHPAARPTAQAA